jgi:hypothetical protein
VAADSLIGINSTAQARWSEAAAQAAEPVFTRAKQILHAARVPADAVETQMVDTVNTQDIVPKASIMASATPFCFCTTQKHLTIKRARSSRT